MFAMPLYAWKIPNTSVINSALEQQAADCFLKCFM